jgi:NitT/TauT family transport system substrate-binding protein
MMKDFYAKGGVSVSDAAMNKEFETRPTFNLAQQLKNMERTGGNANSLVDSWFTELAGFMRETGAVQQVPAVADFVTDEYLRMVQADPKLRDLANSTR